MSIGGPAFPVPEAANSNGQLQASAEAGMTLRDYFAAKALQALISVQTDPGAFFDDSKKAYAYADAMIKSR